MPVTSGTLSGATSLPNLTEAGRSRQPETQNTGSSAARLSHPDLPGRMVQFSQSAGEPLRDLPFDRTRRQETAQNALARFLDSDTPAGAEETYEDMSGAQEIYEDMSGAQVQGESDDEGAYSYARSSAGQDADVYMEMRAPAGQDADLYEDMSGPVDRGDGEYDDVRAPARQDADLYEDMSGSVGRDDGEYDDVRAPARQDADLYEDMSGSVDRSDGEYDDVRAPARQDADLYEDMSGEQETYEDMSGAQVQGDDEGAYSYARTSAGQDADVYVEMSAPAGQDADLYEDMSGSVDRDDGEYDYVRASARQDADLYEDMSGAQETYEDMSGAQETYEDMSGAQETYEDMSGAQETYEDMSGDVYEDMQQGEALYTEPGAVYEEVAPPVREAPLDRTVDRTAAKALARQLKGVHPEVREQMQQLIAAGKVSSQDQLVRLTNEKTAHWVVQKRVDKWYQEGVDQFKKAGFPTSHLETVPTEELFSTIEEAIQRHDGLFKYNEVKSSARKVVSDYLHHNLLRK